MSKRLGAMRRNPRAGTIADVAAVCREAGVLCEAACGGGSHFKVAHPSQNLIPTIPYKRPIKPIYIRKLVAFIDAVRGAP